MPARLNADHLDKRMRLFENSYEFDVIPGLHIITRLDGRGFTRLTKETHAFEAPFDDRFRDLMMQTTEHLMTCGFRIIFGYTQSDEISLLFHVEETARSLRKLNTLLAGEASAKMSLLLGAMAVFDCRISQLPSWQDVTDYFRWRQDDAQRNSLNAHCYWLMRQEGRSVADATHELRLLNFSGKNEFLFQRGVNFNDLPNWQKRGIAVYWESYRKEGVNALTGEASLSSPRRRLKFDLELPLRDAFEAYLKDLIKHNPTFAP